MNRILFIFIMLVFGKPNCIAQNYGWITRAYLNPNISFAVSASKIENNGEGYTKKRPAVFSFGFGTDVFYKFDDNISAGINLSFINKGHLTTIDTYNYGSSYASTDLNFIEGGIFIEKDIEKPKWDFLYSVGLFDGFDLGKIRILQTGYLFTDSNDFGADLFAGVKKNKFYLKIGLKKGLIDIKNTADLPFKTAVICFNAGIYFKNRHRSFLLYPI